MVAIARVKFYDEDKSFGFVRVLNDDRKPSGKELFFHLLSACRLIEGAEAPMFAPDGYAADGAPISVLPKQGDFLVIREGRGNRGQKVRYWNYESEYQTVATRLAARPLYRIVLESQSYDMPERVTVDWEGRNLAVMSAEYPKSEFDDVFCGDFRGIYAHYEHHFEYQLEDGSWKRTDDPRMFICCVPVAIYRQYGPRQRQLECKHQQRA